MTSLGISDAKLFWDGVERENLFLEVHEVSDDDEKIEWLVDYLKKEWGTKVTIRFIERVDTTLEAIRKNPFLYSLHDPSKNIRKCVIHGRIILYYRINGNTVEILRFWNTYQNPEKLKF